MPRPPDFNPAWGHPDHPIVNVTWDDAKRYCDWAGGRLPTEAEWEYAARGGKQGKKYPWGDEINQAHANYDSTGTTPVAKYPQNYWGLYDVSGNVWEWTKDWYDKDYYMTSPEADPPGPTQQTTYRDDLRTACDRPSRLLRREHGGDGERDTISQDSGQRVSER